VKGLPLLVRHENNAERENEVDVLSRGADGDLRRDTEPGFGEHLLNPLPADGMDPSQVPASSSHCEVQDPLEKVTPGCNQFRTELTRATRFEREGQRLRDVEGLMQGLG
jgi:hypothetical protein